MRNLAGCATRCRLRNRTPSCTTGRPDVLPESTYPVDEPGNYVRRIAGCATDGILVATAYK